MTAPAPTAYLDGFKAPTNLAAGQVVLIPVVYKPPVPSAGLALTEADLGSYANELAIALVAKVSDAIHFSSAFEGLSEEQALELLGVQAALTNSSLGEVKEQLKQAQTWARLQVHQPELYVAQPSGEVWAYVKLECVENSPVVVLLIVAGLIALAAASIAGSNAWTATVKDPKVLNTPGADGSLLDTLSTTATAAQIGAIALLGIVALRWIR